MIRTDLESPGTISDILLQNFWNQAILTFGLLRKTRFRQSRTVNNISLPTSPFYNALLPECLWVYSPQHHSSSERPWDSLESQPLQARSFRPFFKTTFRTTVLNCCWP